jgi:hypothetical protein
MATPRIDRARRAADITRKGLVIVSVTAFAGLIAAARGTAAGHHTPRAQPLGAPASFKRVLNSSSFGAGSIAPPQAPPETSTTVS